MRIGSRAPATREPRQVRKEAAISAARRVPRIGLVRVGRLVGHADVSGRRRVHGIHSAAMVAPEPVDPSIRRAVAGPRE